MAEHPNKVLNRLLDKEQITPREYKVLFENKLDYNSEKLQKFQNLIQKIIVLQEQEEVLNLNNIIFPYFDFKILSLNDFKVISFEKCIFEGSILNTDKCTYPINFIFVESIFKEHLNFDKTHFLGSINFDRTVFEKGARFTEAIFEKDTFFRWTIFKDNASFSNTLFKETLDFKKADFENNAYFDNVIFEGLTYFERVRFQKHATFENSESKEYISFAHMQLWRDGIFYLNNSRFSEANYLNLIETDGSILSSKHLINKETARLIKAQFEKQNNITEANKYFALEQKLYLDELKKEGWWKNKDNIFTVGLHKLISDSGTSWIKVLFWIIIFSFIVLVLHDYVPCWEECITTKAECLKSLFTWDTLDRMVELINPANMFKNTNILYQDKEFIGMLVRIITLYLFYQFAMAFRQNTRRK